MAGGPLPDNSPKSRSTINIIKNKKNNIFAIPAAATEIPVKPNTAAIIAITKNMNAHDNMTISL
jgi:hypothetical protein